MDAVIRKYRPADFDVVFRIVQDTIEQVYPLYYPAGAVQFFHNHHSETRMKDDIPKGTTLVVEDYGAVIGTGSLVENEIRRMFILPGEQGKGYGKLLLQELERAAAGNSITRVELDSTLGALRLYEHLGYEVEEYRMFTVYGKDRLCYFRMGKALTGVENNAVNYNNRIFVSVENSGTGEVDSQTRFHYRHEGNSIWADYAGGKIRKGFLIGTVSPAGELDFNYCHINTAGELRSGRCHSVPEVLSDGRLRLREQWQWTDRESSVGESVVEEVSKQ